MSSREMGRWTGLVGRLTGIGEASVVVGGVPTVPWAGRPLLQSAAVVLGE
jgi:hypothetical protein